MPGHVCDGLGSLDGSDRAGRCWFGLRLAAGHGAGLGPEAALNAWLASVRGGVDPPARRLSGLLCDMVRLPVWPVWSLGVLPMINGARLYEPRAVVPTRERPEVTRLRRSRALSHWVWLVPREGVEPEAGCHFLPESRRDRLVVEAPARLDVGAATGMPARWWCRRSASGGASLRWFGSCAGPQEGGGLGGASLLCWRVWRSAGRTSRPPACRKGRSGSRDSRYGLPHRR